MKNNGILPVSENNNPPVAENSANEVKTDTAGQSKSLKTFKKKKIKKLIKTLIIILIIAAALLFLAYKTGFLNKILGKDAAKVETVTTYQLTETQGRRTIYKVLTGTGTIEPNDQYTIYALVNGEILTDYFEKGDTVIKDQILYEIESSSLDSSVTRAENNLKTAQTNLDNAYEDLEKLNVDTDVSGIIQKIYVEVGDDVSAGQTIADIIDTEIMELEVPFLDVEASTFTVGAQAVISFTDSPETLTGTVHEISKITSVNNFGAITRNVTVRVKNTGSITTSTSGIVKIGDSVSNTSAFFKYSDQGSVKAEIGGTVTEIYYAEGSRVNKGTIILKLYSKDLEDRIESLEISLENATTNYTDALDAYDNYNITSPISGTVISKEYKAGDTIAGGANSSNQLAVIYDMSALKFTMSIDELDIDNLEEGQEVIITSDSRAGYSYTGKITNISIQGTTSNGTTVYPVEVTITNEENESQRKVAEDGTITRVYNTGMTSTEKTHILATSEVLPDAAVYTYENGTVVKKVQHDATFSLFIGEEKLNKYNDVSYILDSDIYTFANDFSTVTIEERNEKKMLRPGMNIDAEIIVEKRENVIAIPIDAVGRGNVVKVLKNPEKDHIVETPKEMDGKGAPASGMPDSGMPAVRFTPTYGTASVDAEYEEVRVTVGISDESYIEIIDGLDIGDVIIIQSQERTSTQTGMFGMGMPMGGMGGGMPSMGGGMPSGMGGGMPSGMGGGMSRGSGGMGGMR